MNDLYDYMGSYALNIVKSIAPSSMELSCAPYLSHLMEEALVDDAEFRNKEEQCIKKNQSSTFIF